jgi:hypothetical protein
VRVEVVRERELGVPVTLDNLAGFGWERPLLGVSMWVFMLGFLGFPLTGGFWGKIYVFSAAYDKGWWWLIGSASSSRSSRCQYPRSSARCSCATARAASGTGRRVTRERLPRRVSPFPSRSPSVVLLRTAARRRRELGADALPFYLEARVCGRNHQAPPVRHRGQGAPRTARPPPSAKRLRAGYAGTALERTARGRGAAIRPEQSEAQESLARVEVRPATSAATAERESEEERVPGEPVTPDRVGGEGDRDEHDGENTTSHAS